MYRVRKSEDSNIEREKKNNLKNKKRPHWEDDVPLFVEVKTNKK